MIEIQSIGIQLGSIKIDNKKLETKFGFKKNQIFSKTGIKKRYISSKVETTEILALKATKKILKRTDYKNISHIISVTNTPSILFPTLSHFIHSKLNLPDGINCIGINSGCTGFVDALYLAYKVIKKDKKVIIVTSDTYSKFINKDDRSTMPLFSDGASATIVKFSKNGLILKKTKFSTTNNSMNDLCGKFKNDKKLEILMNGPNVLSFAISDVLPNLKKILQKNPKTTIFCHQAGKIVFKELVNNLTKDVKIPQNYTNYGNLVSTSIPNLILKNWIYYKKSKKLLFSGFGVGLSQSHLFFSR